LRHTKDNRKISNIYLIEFQKAREEVMAEKEELKG
jgi:hypothetical protein